MVKSADRVIRILEFLADVRRPVQVNEVSRAIGSPQSSTSVLLASLQQQGYLEYDVAGKTYQPALRLAMLGYAHHETLLSSTGLVRTMERMSSQLGCTVVLGMLRDSNVEYAFVAAHDSVDRYPARTGGAESLFESALGKALLAPVDRARIRRLVTNFNLMAAPTQPPVQIGDLLTSVAAGSELGYADVPCGLLLPWASVACVLPDKVLGSPAAVGTFCRGGQFQSARGAHIDAMLNLTAAF